MRCLLLGVVILGGFAGPASAADRPVTEDERARLVAAMAQEGCQGGKMEFDDDGKFEIDDAKCADGKAYDLDFDRSFKLIKKKVED